MKDNVRVLQLNKLYAPSIGGIEHFVQQVAELLNDDVDMNVLVCRPKGHAESEIIRGVRVRKTSSLGILFSMPISLTYCHEVKKAAKEADIIILHMPFPLGDLSILLSGFKGKVVLWWHCDVVRQKKLMMLYKPLMKWVLNRAEVIIAATEGHIKGSSYLGEYEEKCHIIPFAVDSALYSDSTEYVYEIENESVNRAVSFLFVGRLVYYKGCDVLIRAFAEAFNDSINDAELVIVGDGPLKDELKTIAFQCGVENRVYFKGSLDDEKLREEYRNCDVFVLPSTEKSEAFGIVQIEAMAYGKPVINTNINSGVPYVGVDGKTGFTVETNNVHQLALAMKQLCYDKEKRRIMGKNARKRVEEKYTEEILEEKLLQHLYSL